MHQSINQRAVLGLRFFCVLGFGLKSCVRDSTSGHICTPARGYFYDKTKIPKKNPRVDYYLLLK